MRITNKMMTGNSMANINNNKEYMDKLNNQMATQKKLTRPSDDPIVAIRALRLRSSLSEVTQYYGANVPDAQAWVSVTESAIESTKEMISGMKALCDQGANGTNTVSERENIYQSLEAYKKQIYANGNATHAGRSVFTGYRTGEALTFKEETTADYRGIWDSFNASDVARNSYIEGSLSMTDINNLNVTDNDNNETTIKEDRVNRIRLSYDNINTKIKNTPYGLQGDEVGSISGWGTTKEWSMYVEGGRLTSDGTGFSANIVVGGTTTTLKLDPRCNKALTWQPDPVGTPPVTEMGLDIVTGKVYATRESDKTTLVYRNALEQPASIDQDKIKNDPIDGLQSFEIEYGGRTYSVTKDIHGRFVGKDKSNPSKEIMVTQNNDKSFTISVGDQNSYRSSTNFNVFNVSANGRTVTSYYAEHNLEVTITTSDAAVTTDGKTAYQYLALGADNKNADAAAKNKIYLLADTGELVFGSDVESTLSGLKDIPGVDTISVKYDKSSFEAGDLRPEHYFDCRQIDDSHIAVPIYSMNYDDHRQAINYEVGTNQTIQINTNAEDVFDTQITRVIDDILTAITGYNNAEEKVNRLTQMQEDASSYTPAQMENIGKLLDAANKELDIAKNKLQKTYETSITEYGNFFNQANLAQTTCGTVENRLTLISNRLASEKTTTTTLASDNENIDITEVAVEVSQAELVYNAALMATGKIAQHTLVDYI